MKKGTNKNWGNQYYQYRLVDRDEVHYMIFDSVYPLQFQKGQKIQLILESSIIGRDPRNENLRVVDVGGVIIYSKEKELIFYYKIVIKDLDKVNGRRKKEYE